MKLFVLDPHTIYRRGLAACLELLDEVESVADAERVRDAWETRRCSRPTSCSSTTRCRRRATSSARSREATGARVIVCTSDCRQDAVLAALQAGAVGFLRKDTLTTESLAAAVRAAADGTGVVTPELLGEPARRHRPSNGGNGRARAAHADRPRAAGAVADRRRAPDARGRASSSATPSAP